MKTGMKRIKSIIIISLIIFCIVFITYYLNEALIFTKGVQNDTKKRDLFLKSKGVKFDSLGEISYKDIKRFLDSIDKTNRKQK